MESYALASEFGVSADWLNDQIRSIKDHFIKEELKEVSELSNILLRVPSARQMLDMKVVAFRLDPYTDRQDIIFLLNYLSVSSYKQAVSIVYKFFRKSHVPKVSLVRLKSLFEELCV
jgi:hypothetical protein